MLPLLIVALGTAPTDLSCVTRAWPPASLRNIYPFTGGEVRAAQCPPIESVGPFNNIIEREAGYNIGCPQPHPKRAAPLRER